MSAVEKEIKEAFFTSIKEGDLKKLKSLISQYPDSFERLYYERLVDTAFESKKANVLLYLIVTYGREVSTNFEVKKKTHISECTGEDEYQQTLEIMAQAIFGLEMEKNKLRSAGCYDLRNLLLACAAGGKAGAEEFLQNHHLSLNPIIAELIQDGSMERYIDKMIKDERYIPGASRHYFTMLNALADNKENLHILSELVDHPKTLAEPAALERRL